MRGISHLALVGLCVACLAVASVSAQDTSSSKRDAAEQQFDRAESLRGDLESQPTASRTEKSYLQVVQAYRRVYYITAHAEEVPAALYAVGSLYRAMGDHYSAQYYQSSVDAYQFLLHDYPTNRYREDALLAVGEIERDNLHDSALARKTFEEFLTLHPHSDGASEARQAIAGIDAAAQAKSSSASASSTDSPTSTSARNATQKSSRASTPDSSESQDYEVPDSSTEAGAAYASESASAQAVNSNSNKVAEVTRIQTWNADTYTRIVINLGGPVKYQSARIPGPDRIYFDLDHAHVDRALLDKQVEVEPGGFLKDVRVAQNQDGVVRVVLEVSQVINYSVFLLDHPSRIIVDVYGTSDAELAKKSSPGASPDASSDASRESSARSSSRSTEHLPAAYVLASPDMTARTSSHSSARVGPAP